MRNEKGDRSSKTRYRFNGDRLALLLSLGCWLSVTIPSEAQLPQAVPISATACPIKLPPLNKKPEPKVLVHEVVVDGITGELQDLVYKTAKTKPGVVSTYSQLRQDITAICNTGFFSRVEPIATDTALGVQVTFKVQANPVLKNIQVVESQVIAEEIINSAFANQYGKVLNFNSLDAGSAKLINWYRQNGYPDATFVGRPVITPDGVVTYRAIKERLTDVRLQGATQLPLQIKQQLFQPLYGKPLSRQHLNETIQKLRTWYLQNGYPLVFFGDLQISNAGIATIEIWETGAVIEQVQVCFLQNREDRVGKPQGKTPTAEILKYVRLKPGDVVNVNRFFREDLQRIIDELGFNSAYVSGHVSTPDRYQDCSTPGKDPQKLTAIVKVLDEDSIQRAENFTFRANSLASGFPTLEKGRQAIQLYEKAQKLYRQEQNINGQILTLNEIGNVHHSLKELSENLKAEKFYREAYKLAQTTRLPLVQIMILNNIGINQLKVEKYEKVIDSYRELYTQLENALVKYPRGKIPFHSSYYVNFRRSSSVDLVIERYFKFGSLIKEEPKESPKKAPPTKPNRIVSSSPPSEGLTPTIYSNTSQIYRIFGDYSQAIYILYRVLNDYIALENSHQPRKNLLRVNESRGDQPQQRTTQSKLDKPDVKEENRTYREYQLQRGIIQFSISKIYADLGEIEQANEVFETAKEAILEAVEALSGKTQRQYWQSIVSVPVDSEGNQFAINFGEELVKIYRRQKDSLGLVNSLNGLSTAYANAGRYAEALNSLQQSLQILNEREFQLEQARQSGNTEPADSSVDASAATASTLERWRYNRRLKASTFNLQGNVLAKSNISAALDSHQQALSIWLDHNDCDQQARTLNSIGQLYINTGQLELATRSFQRSLSLTCSGTDATTPPTRPDATVMAAAHYGLATAAQVRNNIPEALNHIETALQRLPHQPTNRYSESYGFSVNPREQFTAGVRQDEPRLPPDPRSFESLTNPALLNLTNLRQTYVKLYVQLLIQSGQTTKAFEVLEQSRFRQFRLLLNQTLPTGSKSQADADTIKRLIQTYKELTRTLGVIQEQLDEDTVLLEYSLGETQSYVWLVSKTGTPKVYPLRSKVEITHAAKEFYSYLTEPSKRVKLNTTMREGLELSELLLAPVMVDLQRLKPKRIAIVADDYLQYIPFSALPVPQSVPSTTDLANQVKPLMAYHNEIINLPSALALKELRQRRAKRPRPTKTLAVFADPVFGFVDDDRVPTGSKSKQQFEQFYSRLPQTSDKARELVKLVPRPEQLLKKVGLEATHEAATNPELRDYRIIHFATHGILDPKRPERSGMMLSVVNRNRDLTRSLLSTRDVFNTFGDVQANLLADLVVLSGCRTGLGKEAGGEGLIGLSGSFLYGGAKQVVASLWSVDNEATIELMKQFYSAMLRQENPLPPAQALIEAQRYIRSQPQWQAPYYWAGFVIQGDWQ